MSKLWRLIKEFLLFDYEKNEFVHVYTKTNKSSSKADVVQGEKATKAESKSLLLIENSLAMIVLAGSSLFKFTTNGVESVRRSFAKRRAEKKQELEQSKDQNLQNSICASSEADNAPINKIEDSIDEIESDSARSKQNKSHFEDNKFHDSDEDFDKHSFNNEQSDEKEVVDEENDEESSELLDREEKIAEAPRERKWSERFASRSQSNNLKENKKNSLSPHNFKKSQADYSKIKEKSSQSYTDKIKKTPDLVYLVRGKDGGRPAWHYVLVMKKLLPVFLEKTRGGTVDVAQYGSILYSGWGENPPDDIVAKIKEEYGN